MSFESPFFDRMTEQRSKTYGNKENRFFYDSGR